MSAFPRKSERPLPVLFLVPHLGLAGAERQLADLVTRMDRERFRVVVVCQKWGGDCFEWIVGAGLEAYVLGTSSASWIKFAWKLASIARRRRVQAMVIRGFSTGVIGLLVGRILGIRPCIMAEHATGRIDPDPKKRPIERLLAPLVDGVIAVAKGQVPFLTEDKGYDARKVRVIYNGIDLDRWKPRPKDQGILDEFGIPEDAPVVGILAVLRPEKDHDTFLRAARRVLNELPQARFLIVGADYRGGALQRLAESLELGDRAIFTGHRADVDRLLTVFDVAVLSSVTVETFPMSFLEAMALERPLVGTCVGGVPEMIEEGRNGYVVAMRDPEALAEALVKVVRDPETVRRMGRWSRRIVEQRFTMAKMVTDTERYLESFFVIEERASVPGVSPDAG